MQTFAQVADLGLLVLEFLHYSYWTWACVLFSLSLSLSLLDIFFLNSTIISVPCAFIYIPCVVLLFLFHVLFYFCSMCAFIFVPREPDSIQVVDDFIVTFIIQIFSPSLSIFVICHIEKIKNCYYMGIKL